MKKFISALLLIYLALTAAHGASFSAASTSATHIARFNPEEVIGFAKKVERTLGEKGARVAIIARMGRPLAEMPKGMHFTHVAFAVYSQITTSDGRVLPGYAIHNLYQYEDKPDQSRLMQDYPVDFFAGVAQMEAGVIIPSPELQSRLLKLMASPTYAALHEPNYSVIANPFTLGRQNCTEFVLDVINAAIYDKSDKTFLKEVNKQYFTAQPVDVNPFKLLLGTVFSKEVSMSDQPGAPVTATFERIADYLQKYDAASQTLRILPQ
jgi:hypothetical protein